MRNRTDLPAARSLLHPRLGQTKGRLLALGEGGIPYALRVMCDGVIETIGKVNFEGQLGTPFTAHPKRDPANGKLYGFGYQVCLRHAPLNRPARTVIPIVCERGRCLRCDHARDPCSDSDPATTLYKICFPV